MGTIQTVLGGTNQDASESGEKGLSVFQGLPCYEPTYHARKQNARNLKENTKASSCGVRTRRT